MQMVWLTGANVRRTGITAYPIEHIGRLTRPSFSKARCFQRAAPAEGEFIALLTESDEIEHIGYDRDFMESVLADMLTSA